MSFTVDMAAAGGRYDPRVAVFAGAVTGVRNGLGGCEPNLSRWSLDELLDGGYAPVPDRR